MKLWNNWAGSGTVLTVNQAEQAATAAALSLQAAQARGVTVSCDYNYRKKLWKYGKTAPEVKRLDGGDASGRVQR